MSHARRAVVCLQLGERATEHEYGSGRDRVGDYCPDKKPIYVSLPPFVGYGVWALTMVTAQATNAAAAHIPNTLHRSSPSAASPRASYGRPSVPSARRLRFAA